MDGYQEVTKSIAVPPNTGIDGFLRALKQILRKPLVQLVTINSKGKVSYTRYVRDDEPEDRSIDFDDLQPYHIIRNADLQEFMPPMDLPASTIVGMMLDRVAQDRLHPVAFATGAQTHLWDWYRYTTGYSMVARRQLFGLPVLTDRQLPDSVLILCAGFGRDASFSDTQMSYKVEMPTYALPTDEVQVMP